MAVGTNSDSDPLVFFTVPPHSLPSNSKLASISVSVPKHEHRHRHRLRERERMEGEQHSPSLSPNPNAFLRDISNFKTPKYSSHNSKFQLPFPNYFTASKQTPSSSSYSAFRRRPSLAPSSRSKAARKLKAFELEQSQSARKVQIRKEKSLRSLAKSLSAWLNFLFENPRSCGCELSSLTGADHLKDPGTVLPNGKRDSWPGVGVGIERSWRSPKRQRDSQWKARDVVDAEPLLSSSVFSSLAASLQEICSFEDLRQRMGAYLNSGSCNEVLSVMSQVLKNIDEGRLKMKTHCPIVTDVGMKERAIKVLMCYNPAWLQIGLYIVFGGDSLLSTGDFNSDQEVMFLKMVVEKQFFSHAGLAKTYAYNKLVEGLYRPGYFEALGNVILKRFLLLVLILDRAKSQSSLPIKYGIDGIDGGSPPLFVSQSNIKSTRQVIQDFLSSEVMHGEGNLLAHLVIIGYKVSYEQYPLVEYDFRVKELFDDLQDGVRLCRAIQLLQSDASILTKMTVPSDTRKKNVVNCSIAMQYLKQAAVPLSDEDGVMILAEDIANGDKELILSMLWNIFIHLQLPLLINKKQLIEEISKVKEANMLQYSFSVLQDQSNYKTSTLMEMLLEWIQAICQMYSIKVDNFSSLVDGKAMWCLIDYYFSKELHCCSYKETQDTSSKRSVFLTTDNTDVIHNFILSQKLTTMVGNFPEVLQISDILENNGPCNERSVIILLVFLSSQLIGRKNMDQRNIHKLLGCNCQSPDRRQPNLVKCYPNSERQVKDNGPDDYNNEDAVRKFKVIQAWWRDMAKRNHNCELKPPACVVQCHVANKYSIDFQRERAAKIIQSNFRGLIVRHKFLKMKAAISFLQTVIRSWLMVKRRGVFINFNNVMVDQLSVGSQKHLDIFVRYSRFMVDRLSFIKLKKSVLLIQQAARAWIIRRRQSKSLLDLVRAASVIQSCIRGCIARSKYHVRVAEFRKIELLHAKNLQMKAAITIQLAWRKFSFQNSLSKQCSAATVIQSHYCGWLMRKEFLYKREAIIKIQNLIRCLKHQRYFQQYRLETRSATIIQSYIRGWIARSEFRRKYHYIVVLQSHWRCYLMRRKFLCQRDATIKIQSALRCQKCWKTFQHYKSAAIQIQRFVRGQVAQTASCLHSTINKGCKKQISTDCFESLESKILLHSVLKLQRWWKRVLLLKSRTRSAIIIQSHIRRWIAKQKANRERHRIVVIQSYWKGYIARKESKGKLLDLRIRVQKSAANVDDNMRLINRLVAALSELLSIRSVSSILHTCATLDMATRHSQKCCEMLVSAGAIETLLKLIRSTSRSIPDQEVLKHALSTLRNLARYPHLAEALLDTHGSIETIFWELFRNKEEGYFIASELLKKLCSRQKGFEMVHQFPYLLKRLHTLVEDLKRKTSNEKRNARLLPVKDGTERRLKEAVELLRLTING
ncbi:PREDICTED: abnormal spindle-like microcephaly-associated protein homolog isoform X2 [Nelumbo nucifera]|uniref:Abnormal spindle-like microcephaly-associated protein homolog isoform X2 n=1 Tax=Nelumbo nucifera TaxID=4432 RepID=A0A1U8B544_NELNU|nr:PREDICTED: abnormal spindle-like microcephaly-associated protein homolog isoform X2 [Nelumbo nucifera]